MTGRRRGGRLLAWLVRVVLVGAVAAVWFLPPVPEEQATDTASISSYSALMDLNRNGDLSTVETIAVQMPGDKHGIFRIFDTADPRRDNVAHPVTVDAVERDGGPEPYTRSDGAEGTDTIRIGDANIYLDPGGHTYRIVSSTTDVFEPGRRGETLWWWDVVGSGWQMPMEQTSVAVTLPAEPLRAECVRGDDQPCTASVEGTSLRVDTGALAPFTPVTVRVAFDADDVAAPIPGAVGTSVALSLLAAVVALALALLLWWRTREREPGFPVLFEPPSQVPPALGVRVLDEKDSPADLQATLFDLAERGVLVLRGGDESWHVEVVQPPESVQLHPLESGVLLSLGLHGVGDAFVVSSTETSGRKVATARSTLRTAVSGSAAQYLSTSGAGIAAMVAGWACLAATLFMVGRYFFDAGWVRWPLLVGTATFAVAIAGTMFDRGVTTVRTSQGRELWSRTGGFARFLTTDSSEERFDAAAHMDWYPRYLAWAVALGVGEEWARRYEAQGVAVPEVPWIIWTGTGTRFDAGSMSRSFDGAISSASAAYAAAQAAKSSSSGGGFSGGSGGGGGGGGSW